MVTIEPVPRTEPPQNRVTSPPDFATSIGAWTTDEAAHVLGMAVHSIRRAIFTGRLRSVKIGHKRYVPYVAVVDYFWAALWNPGTREHTLRILESRAAALGQPCDIRAQFEEMLRAKGGHG